MPELKENKECWDGHYDWKTGGDEWSRAWGGPDMQWYGTLLPRLHRYLPVNTMLEIAPGFGRWTQYLKRFARKLYLVDLSESCIENCRRRFKEEGHIEYYQNDGKSLAMIPNNSIDLVFSFDSLVHAEVDVIEAYIKQLTHKLAPQGVAFIHHSNLGGLKDRPASDKSHWRASSVSGPLFLEICRRHGLCPLSQETINWGGPFMLDCISVFALPGSRFAGDLVVFENPDFMNEALELRRISSLYGERCPR